LNSATEELFRQSYDTLDKTTKDLYEKRNIDAAHFRAQFLVNESVFVEQLNILTNKDFQNQLAQETNATAKEAIRLRERAALDKVQTESQNRINDNEKLIVDSEKKVTDEKQKEADKRFKNAKEKIDAELELREAANKKVLTMAEAEGKLTKEQIEQVKRDLGAIFEQSTKTPTSISKFDTSFEIPEIDESTKQRKKMDIVGGFLLFRKEKLLEELKSVEAGSEQETEIYRKLNLLKAEAETTYYTQKKEKSDQSAEQAKKAADEEQKAAERLLKIKYDVLKAENDILEFRQEQKRKVLENTIESNSTGTQGRYDALVRLRDFDLSENLRQQTARDKEYAAQKDFALEKAKGLTNEKQLVEEINNLYAQRTALSKEEKDARDADIKKQADLKIEQSGIDASGGGFLGGVLQSAGIGAEELNKKFEPLKTIGNIIGSQFNAIAGAVGNAVKAFVLFGSAGGGFKKFAAEVIASIAQMAAVQAVFELAQGLAMLALAYFGFHPKAAISATEHFAAAAIFGTVAGVSAVVGRGVAGDSFKQNSSSSFNQQTSSGAISTTQGRTGSSNGGTAYSGATSSDSTRISEENRNNSSRQNEVIHKHEIKLTMDKGVIVQEVSKNINDRGALHGLIIKTADS